MMATRILLLGIALIPALLWSLPSVAAVSPEVRVKAAYLYKFASFVRWPDSTARGGEFRICVAGSSEIARVLRELVRSERIMGRPISVGDLDAGDRARVPTCDVLYLAREPQTANVLLNAAKTRPILTVADQRGGTSGGVIDFVVRDGKVRFVVSRSSAREQGLDLSSKLLDAAMTVRP
jgi:hypothetical protein